MKYVPDSQMGEEGKKDRMEGKGGEEGKGREGERERNRRLGHEHAECRNRLVVLFTNMLKGGQYVSWVLTLLFPLCCSFAVSQNEKERKNLTVLRSWSRHCGMVG